MSSANFAQELDLKGRDAEHRHMANKLEILCIGGAVMDRKFQLEAAAIAGTSNPASASSNWGGVARNVCETLAHLGIRTALATRVGRDAAGLDMLAALKILGVDTNPSIVDAQSSTAEYVAVLDQNGALAFGLAAMGIFDALTLPQHWQKCGAVWVFADCNLPARELAALSGRSGQPHVKLAVDCVSVAKSRRLSASLVGVDLLFANSDEAAALLCTTLEPRTAAEELRAKGAAAVVLTLGGQGLVLADANGAVHLPAQPTNVLDVTGAGDALVAATLAGLAKGMDLRSAAILGMQAATWTIGVVQSVRGDIAALLAAPWQR